MTSRFPRWASRHWLAIAACFLGTTYCLYLLRDLANPFAVEWLFYSEDPAQQYLGWVFFRHDEWRWPLTFTNSIVFPTGASIALTDSLPLIAIPAKLLSRLSLLPEGFQYFGLYSALSLVLQFYWGGALGLLLCSGNSRLDSRQRRFCALVSGCFFLLAPPLTWRIGLHTALASHWLILASLWSYLATGATRGLPVRRLVALNCGLLAVASGLHPYLATMAAGLILAAYTKAYLVRWVSGRTALGLLASVPAVLLSGWWFFGYFHGSYQNSAYGWRVLNLQSFLDPQQFSLLFDSLDVPEMQLGGFAYLGIGTMILVLLNARYLITRVATGIDSPSVGPLLALSFAFLLFALGNNIFFGDRVVLAYPLPDFVLELFGSFRASNRFVWPVFYLVMAGALAGSFRFADRRSFQLLLCLALVAQFVELTPLHSWRRELVQDQAALVSPLPSPEWHELAPRHDKLIVLPSLVCQKQSVAPFPRFARIAARQNLKVNDFYLARRSEELIQQHCEQLPAAVRSGELDPSAAYVLRPREYRETLDRIHADPHGSHTCSRLDGTVLCVRR